MQYVSGIFFFLDPFPAGARNAVFSIPERLYRSFLLMRSQIDYSAFDPVFWLHHTNVDRLFAIWQAIYPKSFVGSEKSLFGSATISEGDILTENTPLKPFHRNSAGSYWTSASARSTLSFNYNYPETRDTNIAAVKRAVNALYSVSAGQRIARRSVPEENSTQKRSIRSSMMNAFRRSTYVPANPTSSPVYTEWITNIRVAEDALPKTFHVHIFLGDATSEPTSYQLDKNLVGTHTVFTKFNGQARDLIVTGTMPLTQAIVTHGAAGKVDTTDDKCVEDYLTKNLHWKITNVS